VRGGVSYIAYDGVGQQSVFQQAAQIVETERAHVLGGKLVLHVPSRQFFRISDVAVHRQHRDGSDNKPDEIYGVELQLDNLPTASLPGCSRLFVSTGWIETAVMRIKAA
jgi:hypothetical protein